MVIYYIIALAVIAIDQWTKWLIVKYMRLGESIPIIPNVLYITSHRNRGAAWGILQGQFWLFYLITVIVVIGLIVYIQRLPRGERLFGVALGLMLGGAIGNFIDRLFRKEVVDFIHAYIGTYSFPVFNIADSALTIGVALLFIKMFFFATSEKENQ
ncbi:signal peptidase II [Saccharococcus caldoxylosilyticus]|jgi:signal peptidase II|uniref:signal peptidase II n=1 Tax=Saccharococcus caldoxylosilyticus TaxID=81408 RepID=UPI001FCC0DA9|nr:signal peptidase II [Parageobacillus caldoxylosilyticus]BDG35071.1 lipoprotein signal peptidase [Parageobacillus caldoxylosilyticus]BDG38846.1 lipoprotein signal peptidase [Parageobacillus caldoxylosilyticus]BDG42646.1 lipoprotein signal peptidase [Parageobacillus caldoxylosilyticus]